MRTDEQPCLSMKTVFIDSRSDIDDLRTRDSRMDGMARADK